MLEYVIFISGTEPLSYYLINGFLNFNVVFFMAILSLPFLVSVYSEYYLYLSRTLDKHKMFMQKNKMAVAVVSVHSEYYLYLSRTLDKHKIFMQKKQDGSSGSKCTLRILPVSF